MADTEEKIDKLNRTEFVRFIETLIINSEQYRRDNNSNSYVIALDSAWGTGKTYFLGLLNQDIKASKDIYVINYNAWENDYCDNAFNPLLYDILNSKCLKFNIDATADKENTKNILWNIFRIGTAFGKQVLEDVVEEKFGIKIEKALEAAETATKDIKSIILSQIPGLEELNKQRDAFCEFKKYLSTATNWIKKNNGKLVIIIDELDRCKPTFAIQTLEIVKHIFDIDNIVFLFAIDIKQLSHSISSVYGQGFDSTGYLCRFFDYIAKMPAPDVKPYIAERIKEIQQIPENDSIYIRTKKRASFTQIISDYVYDIYTMFDFSLRDLDTVIQSYRILVDTLLKDYEMYGAHMIYIFYLSLKYKKRDMFDKVFIDTADYRKYISTELHNFVNMYPTENPWLKASIDAMYANQPLCELELLPTCDSMGKSNSEVRIKIKSVNDKKLNASYNYFNGSRTVDKPIEVTNWIGASVGNILFNADFDKWEKIKEQTLREYLHKQLEMFSFIEPVDADSF